MMPTIAPLDLPPAAMRKRIAEIPLSERCDPQCPTWGVFDSDRHGLNVERCDECWMDQHVEVLIDDHMARLPEAQVALEEERSRELSPDAMTLNQLLAEASRLRKIQWCRARLLHALAGAAAQGVLQEVLEELLDEDSGPEDGFEVHERVLRALKANGWLAEDEVPA